MSRIIFATGNQNKMREIREIMQGFRVNGEEIEILSMKEAGVYTDIVEDGMTFVENASIKAKAIAVLAPGDFVMAEGRAEGAAHGAVCLCDCSRDAGRSIAYN